MNFLEVLGPRLIFLSSGSQSHRHGPGSAGSTENTANVKESRDETGKLAPGTCFESFL